jgi:PAS domain S-box-containing protein
MAQIQDITERKRAQEGLLLTSDRLSLATRAGGVGIWDYDVVNDNLTWDDQMFRLYGKARERFSSAYEAWKSSLLPEDLQRGDDEVQMALRGEKEFDTEFRVLWQDGTVHYIRALALVQRDASGKALRMVGTNWDMTDLKRAEDALKVSESRFRDIFNSANDAIFLNELGPDFRPGATVDVNDAACRMLGYSHEELLRLTPNEFAPKRKESDLDRICLELKERGMVKFQEEELRSDGTFIPVEINARRIEFMNRTMALAVARDITERIRTEELLRQNEETLRLVVDAAPFPLMITDVDGTYILDGNGKAVTYFGLDLTQGQSLRDLFAQEAELQALMGAASEKGSVDGMEVTVRVKGGGTRRAIVSMRPMHHLGEARWIIATYDISERYAMEKALQQANKKLGMLNSITRHDVVNQILALSGYIELCKIKEKDETLQRYLERIAKAADNIRMQIAFTREYQDVGVQAPTWAAPGRQAAEAFAQLRPLDVTFADETEGVEVLADPLAEKVPYNLIDNSMRHGERVEHIKMSGRRAGDTLLIVYEDDGVGISEDDKKRLFEKGFGKNTGFGLFLCREILAITGITITETGKQGEGARFEMIVPEGAWRYPRGDK